MRNTIRVYVLAFSIFASLSAPAFAAPSNPTSDDSFFTRVKNVLVFIFEEAKIVVPVG
jgi:hypothetical protein